jgi:hypothetical protein|tara:strand:+ start:1025 stop:1219 length:195 start_codon:yes stop_codon:yes gene_type:complete
MGSKGKSRTSGRSFVKKENKQRRRNEANQLERKWRKQENIERRTWNQVEIEPFDTDKDRFENLA